MTDILKEAFKQFELLEERAFDINDIDKEGDSLEDWVKSDVEVPVEVVDMGCDDEAMAKADEAIGTLETGDYLLVCKNEMCGHRISKHPQDEDIAAYLKGEEPCPWCGEHSGFALSDKVVPFKEQHNVELKDNDEIEVEEDDDIEIENKDKKESLKVRRRKSLKEGFGDYEADAYDTFDINDDASVASLNYVEEEARLDRRELEQFLGQWRAWSKGEILTLTNLNQWADDRLRGFSQKQQEEIKEYICDEEGINESCNKKKYKNCKKINEEKEEEAEFVENHNGIDIFHCKKCGKYKAKIGEKKIKKNSVEEVERAIDKLLPESINTNRRKKFNEAMLGWGITLKMLDDYFKKPASFEEAKQMAKKGAKWSFLKDENLFNKYKDLGLKISKDGKYAWNGNNSGNLEIYDANDSRVEITDISNDMSNFISSKKEGLESSQGKEQLLRRLNNIKAKLGIKDESLKEGIENMSLETEHDIINITSEKKDVPESGDMMATPIPEEEQDEIFNNINREEDEEEFEEPQPEEPFEEPSPEEPLNTEPLEDEFEAEEIKEESFNRLGERYLRNTYTNVKSFKTESVSYKNKKLILEGTITFNSGNKKKTKFVLEKVSSRRYGPARVQYVKFQGLNESFSKDKKAFTLTGKVDKNKNFLCCGLEYNYTAKNKLNESLKKISGKVEL